MPGEAVMSGATDLMKRKEDMKKEMSLVVLSFKKNFEKRMTALRQKHRRERLYWVKLQKQTGTKTTHSASIKKQSVWNLRNTFFVRSSEAENYLEHNGVYRSRRASSLRREEMSRSETFV